jgi:NTE family protein
MLDFVTRLLSPYQFNSMNFNPLRDVLEQLVDFDVLKRTDRPVKLFLSATNVRTGKVKVFEKHEISVSTALASACLDVPSGGNRRRGLLGWRLYGKSGAFPAYL